MREIKAYVRPERVEYVVRALHDAGVAHMAVTHVRSLGTLVDPEHVHVSMEAGTQYTEHAKIEFVCAEPEADELVARVRQQARTGAAGDGIIIVLEVQRAVKIRTGVEGRDALR